MTGHYILVGKEVVPASKEEWAEWYSARDSRRIVEQTDGPNARVSTVFLGLDHAFGGGPPLVFETMIFGGEHDQYQKRCTTWDEAVAQHEEACRLMFNLHIRSLE